MKIWLACAVLLASFGAPAAVGFVNGATKTGCATGGVSCAAPLGFTAAVGDDLVVSISKDPDAQPCTVASITDSSGTNTYALKATHVNTTCGANGDTWVSHLGATATSVTVNFTSCATSQFTLITAMELSGVATYGVTGGTTGNSTTSTAAITLQNAANWAVGVVHSCTLGVGDTYVATVGTVRVQANGNANNSGIIAAMTSSTGGTITATTATAQWVSSVVEACATNPCAGSATAAPTRSLMGVGQ